MAYTGVVLTILSLHLAVFLILLGHWCVAAGMFPRATRSFAAVYEGRGIRATLVGIFTYGPLILLMLNAGANPLLRLVALAAGFAALLIALAGSAGLALRIGRNLCAQASPWQQALRGGTMLALVFITPVLGSLFLLHIGLASGFGAFLLAKPWKDSSPAPQPAEPVASVLPPPVAALS